MDQKWDLLLSKFRNLGGIAENVYQKEGRLGRGIFSINPNLKSRIYTPAKLLIKKEDICLDGNQLRIKKDKEYSEEVRDFFNYYQDHFSWGGGGKETTESFEKGLSLFPLDLKKLMKKNMLVDIEERHKGNWDCVIKKQFLNARGLKFKNHSVIAPVWDLVNHEVNAFPFVTRFDGIGTPDYAPRDYELTFVYGYKSSIRRVINYGFFCQEPIVFSLPFNISLRDSRFKFICKGLELKKDKIEYQATNSQIIINGLPIVAINQPLFIKNYFERLLELTNFKNIPQDFFPNIVSFNYLRRKEILDKLNLIDNFSSRIISRAINYEMDLISHV